MEKCYRNLRQFLDGGSEIWLKYNKYIKLNSGEFDEEELVLVNTTGGSIMLQKCLPKYSRLHLIESTIDFMRTPGSQSRRITRIRDLIFIDSQLFVKTPGGTVLKLSDDNGFLWLRTPDKEFKSILRQLKDNDKSAQPYGWV